MVVTLICEVPLKKGGGGGGGGPPPSSLCRSWRPGAAGRSPVPDLCTSQLNPYRPACTEPETAHTGYCEKGRWKTHRGKHIDDRCAQMCVLITEVIGE